MFKYLFYFFVFLSINNFSAFAMQTPLEELGTSGTIKVYFKNKALALERPDLKDLKFTSPTSPVPYILPNRTSHDFQYAIDVHLQITLKTQDKSESIWITIPKENEKSVLIHEFPFEDKTKLIGISAQIHASVYGGGRINSTGEWENDGSDVRHVDLGSAWDPLTPDSQNRLQSGGELYLFFTNKPSDNMNNLFFGFNQ